MGLMDWIRNLNWFRKKEVVAPTVPMNTEVTYRGYTESEKAELKKKKEAPIMWFRFLPEGVPLNLYICYLLDAKWSDSKIIQTCAMHASRHGHPDTKRLREKISNSIRWTRSHLQCNTMKGKALMASKLPKRKRYPISKTRSYLNPNTTTSGACP
jgi:hypothetical protein